jgi:hypothetical protein
VTDNCDVDSCPTAARVLREANAGRGRRRAMRRAVVGGGIKSFGIIIDVEGYQ